MPFDRLRFGEHVIMRMTQRSLSRSDIRQVLNAGDIIET
jgi:hypothetical protein